MARPTNDKKDKTLILRVNADTKAQIEYKAKKAGKSISDYVRDEILGEHDNVIQNKEDIFQEIMDKAVYREINSMCKASGITTHDFYRGVMNLWERGKLEIDRDKVISKGEYNLDEFIEMCHMMNEYPQKVIDKIVKGLR